MSDMVLLLTKANQIADDSLDLIRLT